MSEYIGIPGKVLTGIKGCQLAVCRVCKSITLVEMPVRRAAVFPLVGGV